MHSNIPTCGTEILVGRNEPIRYSISRECLLTLRSYWLVPVHRGVPLYGEGGYEISTSPQTGIKIGIKGFEGYNLASNVAP
jgi:hypothetical protein